MICVLQLDSDVPRENKLVLEKFPDRFYLSLLETLLGCMIQMIIHYLLVDLQIFDSFRLMYLFTYSCLLGHSTLFCNL